MILAVDIGIGKGAANSGKQLNLQFSSTHIKFDGNTFPLTIFSNYANRVMNCLLLLVCVVMSKRTTAGMFVIVNNSI